MRKILRKYIFLVLDKLPNFLGNIVYHKIQEYCNVSLEKTNSANKNSFVKTKNILKNIGFDLKEKNIIEIGSGWRPIMPYYFKYFGNCGTVFTYDINQHYNKKWIRQLNQFFLQEYKIKVSPRESLLPNFVKYFPNKNIIDEDLSQRIDLIFSRFVLEHVKPADLLQMHQKFFQEIDDEAVILHLISPSDHRSYSDSDLSLQDFLRYSQEEWDRIQTRFDYHNRLRLPQYLKIFDESGFDVVFLEYGKPEPGSKQHVKFKNLVLHDDYLKFSDEENMAGSVNIVLKKRQV